MFRAPCKSCEKCGCGAYHDKCEAYQEYLRKWKETEKRRRLDAYIKSPLPGKGKKRDNIRK